MPGIFGYVAPTAGDDFARVEAAARANLCHVDSYRFRCVRVDGHLAGIAAPYDIDGIGPHHDRRHGLVINVDGRIDHYTDGDGVHREPNPGNLHAILADLYLAHGADLPRHVSGSFNLSIYDQDRRSLLVCNDIIGNRYLYHCRRPELFLYGGELKAFIAHPGFRAAADAGAMADLCNFGRLWGNKSLLDGVELLPAASTLELAAGEVRIAPYFVPRHARSRCRATDDELIDEGWRLINQSVDRCLAGKRRVVVPITAGLDSRLILAIVRRRDVDVTCYTHADQRSCIEYELARNVTDTLGVAKHEFSLIRPDDVGRNLHWAAWLNDGAELASASYHAQTSHKMARDGDGLLNGIFGGHLSFSDGYYFPEHDHPGYTLAESHDLFAGMVNVRGRSPRPGRPGVFTPDFSERRRRAAERTIAAGVQEFADVTDNFAEQWLYYINKVFLRNMMNRKDINRYFQADELVYADPELYRFRLDTPLARMRDNLIYYGIYRKYLPDVMDLPTLHTGDPGVRRNVRADSGARQPGSRPWLLRLSHYLTRLTGGRISFRDRFHYRNYDHWYRASRPLRQAIGDVLLSDRTLAREHLDADGIRRLVDRQNRGGSAYSLLLQLVQMELFQRYFVDGDAKPAAALTGD